MKPTKRKWRDQVEGHVLRRSPQDVRLCVPDGYARELAYTLDQYEDEMADLKRKLAAAEEAGVATHNELVALRESKSNCSHDWQPSRLPAEFCSRCGEYRPEPAESPHLCTDCAALGACQTPARCKPPHDSGPSRELLSRIESAIAYTCGTIAPGNYFPSEKRPKWVEVHGGRAHSSYRQLSLCLDELRAHLKTLPERNS